MLADNNIGSLVFVSDPTDADGYHIPNGKQTLTRSHIFYTPCSGIWQTVWLESVPDNYITGMDIAAGADGNGEWLQIHFSTLVTKNTDRASNCNNLRLRERTKPRRDFCTRQRRTNYRLPKERRVQQDIYLQRALGPPPTVDARHPKVVQPDRQDGRRHRVELHWVPHHILRYCQGGSTAPSERKVRFPLWNAGPGVLAGWHPSSTNTGSDGVGSAPAEKAGDEHGSKTRELSVKTLLLCRVLLTQRQIKIEPDLFYHACDRLGLLVYQDMPSMKATVNVRDDIPTADDQAEFERQLELMINEHKSYPSIVAWVLYNEGWGQIKLAYQPEIGLVDRVRKLDPTRLIDATSGWYDHGAGDFSVSCAPPGDAQVLIAIRTTTTTRNHNAARRSTQAHLHRMTQIGLAFKASSAE